MNQAFHGKRYFGSYLKTATSLGGQAQ